MTNTTHDTDQPATPADMTAVETTTDAPEHATDDTDTTTPTTDDTAANAPGDVEAVEDNAEPGASGDEPDGAEAEGEGDPRIRKANKEAARYRHQLRETEADRDALAARVAGLERAVLKHVNPVADVISVEGLVKLGMDPAAYVGADGTVDVDAMSTAARNLAAEYGLRSAQLPYAGAVGRESGRATEANWLKAAQTNRRGYAD